MPALPTSAGKIKTASDSKSNVLPSDIVADVIPSLRAVKKDRKSVV